jgi:hypothetical protein
MSLEPNLDFKSLLPLNSLGNALLKAVHDGTVLYKLCNLPFPKSPDAPVVATHKKVNTFSLLGRITLALDTVKSVGCQRQSAGHPRRNSAPRTGRAPHPSRADEVDHIDGEPRALQAEEGESLANFMK